MLEIHELTEDNISEVAKVTGRREIDLKLLLTEEDGTRVKGPVKIWVETPDVPEGFMRSNR